MYTGAVWQVDSNTEQRRCVFFNGCAQADGVVDGHGNREILRRIRYCSFLGASEKVSNHHTIHGAWLNCRKQKEFMLQINAKRFLENLAELGQIGVAADGSGLDRRPFSKAERGTRDFICSQAELAGLIVEVDAVANLSVKVPTAEAGAQTLLFGSHLDTVPHGGPYDGALGVVAALEVLRTVQEAGIVLPVHLEAIAFTDEEGRLADLTGSRVFTGDYSREQIERFLARAGQFADDLASMRSAVAGGLTVASLSAAKRDLAQIAAYVELHIEQGPQLERAGVSIGVVEAIFGRVAYEVTFIGRSDHAGTTPMHLRADALVAAAGFVAQAAALVAARFPGAVFTCGDVRVRPGVYNVVPNRVELLVEFRAGSMSILGDVDQALRNMLDELTNAPGLSYQLNLTGYLEPRFMDRQVQAAISGACQHLGYGQMRSASGALHDAHSLAHHVRSGMIFVPSIGGRSHCPDEATDRDDLVAGANILLHTILGLAGVETSWQQ